MFFGGRLKVEEAREHLARAARGVNFWEEVGKLELRPLQHILVELVEGNSTTKSIFESLLISMEDISRHTKVNIYENSEEVEEGSKYQAKQAIDVRKSQQPLFIMNAF